MIAATEHWRTGAAEPFHAMGALEWKDEGGGGAGGGGDGDVKKAFGDFMSAFDTFKTKNDERLKEIETKGNADPVTTEQVEKINGALGELEKRLKAAEVKAARPGGVDPSKDAKSADELAHREAVKSYIRKGNEDGLRELEVKAARVNSDPDGGYLVGEEVDTMITRALGKVSAMRSLATVRSISAAVFKKPYSPGGATAGWVGEEGGRPQTGTPTLKELAFPAMELYAMPAATQTLLDDAAVDVEAWLGDEVAITFAEQEGAAFITGDGVSQPRGVFAYPTSAAYKWGSLQHVTTGAAGDFSGGPDRLVDLVYTLKSGYRQNASWLLGRPTLAAIRKMKDTDGNYIWSPGMVAGQPSSLLGFPVAEDDDVPVMANNSLSIAFGDFRRGYLVVDRIGARILRDPYSSKPYVLFYTTKRVGGGVQDFDAIKLLKFAA